MNLQNNIRSGSSLGHGSNLKPGRGLRDDALLPERKDQASNAAIAYAWELRGEQIQWRERGN